MMDVNEKIYDVLILGGGPAGLSTTIYARRANLQVLLIEKGIHGGLIFNTAEIDNYPGGVKGESGAEFSMRLAEQAKSFGPDTVTDEITGVELDGEVKTLTGKAGVYRGRTLIIATGNVPRTLDVPGESEFTGRGVSYCATCDGPFFTGLDIYVAGGGNSALEEAVHLAKFGRKVTIVHRRDEFRADKAIQEKIFRCNNVEFMLDTVVRELKGGDLLDAVVVENVRTGDVREIHADAGSSFGFFVFVGMLPQTEIFEGKLAMEQGYIVTDEEMRTSIAGVYAVGDVRKKTLRQIVTAAADGAIAAVQCEKLLE
ncbi:MAG: FAD-dependent oxidoreductase [Clostridiales Family XIII bacterium]|jgi:thioredoxin reductase (NADPH)|nr:FAD-dependent oxidoreductase [Clostridiales Family XIII bacterium]